MVSNVGSPNRKFDRKGLEPGTAEFLAHALDVSEIGPRVTELAMVKAEVLDLLEEAARAMDRTCGNWGASARKIRALEDAVSEDFSKQVAFAGYRLSEMVGLHMGAVIASARKLVRR